MTHPDVLVIGAGMVGAWTALGLAERGLRVLVVDGGVPGGGSTGAAMGHLVVMDDSPAQLALCAHAMMRWRTAAPELPPSAEYDPAGTLWLACSDDELAEAHRKQEVYAVAGVSTEVLDAVALGQAEPLVAPGLAGGLRVPGDAICYPPAIVRTLLERAIALGAIVINQAVRAIRPGGAQLTDGTWLEAGVVVVAAGPQSGMLVPDLPVIPRRGHLVITERAPRRIHHQLVELGYLHSAHTLGGASVAFNVQPRVTGQLLVGSSRELVGFAPGLNRELLAMMLARASAIVPALAGMRVIRSWTGFRPATPDALPLIGAWPALERTWIATGHEGLGITLAPATADLIVAGILGEPPPVPSAAFAPDRPMPTLAAA